MKRTWADLERRSIARALEAWHDFGREKFIAGTKFKESNRYVVIDKGQRVDSKPLLAMAYQLQFRCGKNEVPRLSGGHETRTILKRLGYTLVDLRGEILQDGGSPLSIAVGPATRFWWANQSQNFDSVYMGRTLWAALVGRGGQQVDHWLSLKDVRPGDIVLHYSSPELRAVSRVATTPQPAYPPRGYDMPATAEGTLVLTEPISDVHIPRDTVLEVLEDGQGPVNADGTLRRGYFFQVEADQALELLQWAGLEPVDESETGEPGPEMTEQFLGGASDRMTITAVRAEQRFLRGQQIRRWGSSCSLCGRALPEELLVAAHIKPRWACAESERMDTLHVSMLACLFGCDALFELGYLVISDKGVIERGPRSSTPVEDRVRDLVGRQCLAHSDSSRHYFAWHRQHHFAGQRKQG